jgi:hypothetical protein
LTSGADGNLVQYRSYGDGCPSGTISFATLGQDTSERFVFSGSVGFAVVVP